MNTLDTEWWKKVVDEDFCSFSPLTRDAINELIDKVVSSRDTYWKERVRKIEDDVRNLKRRSDSSTYLYGQGESNAYEAVLKLLTPITNEDNLK